MNELDATLSALADPARRRVVELLCERPLRAGQVAERMALSPPVMSKHLRALRAGGLVDVELSDEDGRARRYRLNPERLVTLQTWLSEIGGHWDKQLAAFREHAERADGGAA